MGGSGSLCVVAVAFLPAVCLALSDCRARLTLRCLAYLPGSKGFQLAIVRAHNLAVSSSTIPGNLLRISTSVPGSPVTSYARRIVVAAAHRRETSDNDQGTSPGGRPTLRRVIAVIGHMWPARPTPSSVGRTHGFGNPPRLTVVLNPLGRIWRKQLSGRR